MHSTPYPKIQNIAGQIDFMVLYIKDSARTPPIFLAPFAKTIETIPSIDKYTKHNKHYQ